jgi:hypothetical protein
MSVQTTAGRVRAKAASWPTLRRLVSKVRRRGSSPAQGDNGSSWTIGEAPLRSVEQLYRGSFPLPPASYGTVRDFADSVDNMPGLAGANFDMKDLQRCWMLKAILGNATPGSRILEIGAGEPLVAGALSRLGYDVTVVDPYDGSGNGPQEYETFTNSYRDLTFIREQFPPSRPLEPGFGAIYSISVLEHVPLEAIDGVMAGAQQLLGAGGCSIHAVDHVLAGWGAEEHLEKLRRIAAGMNVGSDDLERAMGALADDPDSYFVSAEAHNRWRGALEYDQYPMRRIVSVNLFNRS